ncbi:MAG: integrase [Proteobacteria bacterium]|nr:integrase [Pseudomonadota bacterium]
MSIWTDEQGRTHVGIMVSGKRIHRRLPEGTSKSDAKLIEANLRKAAGRKQTHIPGDPSLTEIMGLYIAHADTLRSPETAKHHALRAGPWCEGKKASEADLVVAKMIDDMRGHYAPATINRSIGAIKAALKIAFRQRIISEDIAARISRLPENNQRHTYLSVEQVKKLSDHCSEQVRAAVWIALLTGCRRGEILGLEKEDIKGNYLCILAGNTKTLRQRSVPIVPALRPWLEYIPLKINFEGLKTGFGRARKKAGIEANFHDLRHSCASLLINMGTPLEVVRDILGHTTVKTTERYAHLHVDRQAEALDKLSMAVLG